MDEALRREIDRFVEENTENIKRDIARLVAINSVEGSPEEDAPFGRGPREALNLGLAIARELGLGAVDCEGRIGYAALGEGERYLATITHLDVVPVADGWNPMSLIFRFRIVPPVTSLKSPAYVRGVNVRFEIVKLPPS